MKKNISILRTFLKTIVPGAILLTAVVVAYAMIETAPKAQRMKPQVVAPSVEVRVFQRAAHPVRIEVMGSVRAAHEVTVESRLSGEVISVNKSLIPGGFLKAGDEILRIDPTDYELAISAIEAEVAEAQYNLKVEEANKVVAEREWTEDMIGVDTAPMFSGLALRQPNMAAARADLAAARDKLAQAKLDLERTIITAPFDAMVETKSVDIGANVSSQETLATLVGVDEFWVMVSTPVDRLDWITFPMAEGQAGSKAIITSGSGANTHTYEGEVIRLLPSLETEGRMARVLVSVKDPMNMAQDPDRKPLLIGSYVKVVIDGGELADSYAIPRRAYRDNGKIWLLSDQGTLEIRSVEPIWRDGENIYLSQGLEQDEQVIVGAIAAPLQGMELQAAGSEMDKAEDQGTAEMSPPEAAHEGQGHE